MRKLLLIASFAILLGCGSNNNHNGEEILFSEINDDIEFQQTVKILDVPDSLVLGTVIQVEFVEEMIFVLTSQSGSGELNAFDVNGEYIGKIGDYGRGGGEYIMPTSFCIYKDKIYVFDVGVNSVLAYDKKTFEFLTTNKMPQEVSSVAYLNDNIVVSYGQLGEYYFNYMNGDYKMEKSFVENFRGTEYSGYSTGTFNPMCKVGDKLRLYTPFSTTIYEADEQGVIPKYSLKLGDFKMPDRDFILKIANNETFFSDLENSGTIFEYSFFETKESMLIEFYVNNDKYIGYYKKGDKEGKIMSGSKLKNGEAYMVGVYGDYFVASVDNYEQEDVAINDIVLLLFK